MDRREALKKLALGGVAMVGGTGLIVGTAGAQKGGKGGGKPGTGGEDPPAEDPPTGAQLLVEGPATIELLIFGGGRAKARLRLPESQGGWHGWDLVAEDGANVDMSYEQMSLETKSIEATEQLDVKGKLDSGKKSGWYTFDYWRGPNSDGTSAEARYRVKVKVTDRSLDGYEAELLL